MARCWNVGLLCFVALLVVFWSQGDAKLIRYRDCGNGTKLLKVDLTPCSEEPCQFHHNTSATVTAWFDAVEDSSKLSIKVYGIVDDIKIPFPIPNTDGCKNSGIKCPVKQATSYVYQNSMKILPSYPSLKLVNEWDMYGDNKMMFCFEFPLIIEPGSTSGDINDEKPAEYRIKPQT